MTDPQLSEVRRAVRQAANRLAQDAPALTAASADALRAGLAIRVAALRRAVVTAWRAGIPPRVIADDGRKGALLPHEWVS
nr:hypothetical protein OG781_09480 [Streptomyces sp. NBC_00830]